MVRELARLSPPSGPHPPRCLRWCSRAVWETAPSSTRRPPASPCSAPRITPSCSVLCLCPRWVWCDILCWFDSINLISLLLSQPNDFQHSTHFPCHCHSKYFNNVPWNENFTIKFSVVIRTLYTRRRCLVTRITRPALAQTQTRPPHPRWDIAWHILLLLTLHTNSGRCEVEHDRLWENSAQSRHDWARSPVSVRDQAKVTQSLSPGTQVTDCSKTLL